MVDVQSATAKLYTRAAQFAHTFDTLSQVVDFIAFRQGGASATQGSRERMEATGMPLNEFWPSAKQIEYFWLPAIGQASSGSHPGDPLMS